MSVRFFNSLQFCLTFSHSCQTFCILTQLGVYILVLIFSRSLIAMHGQWKPTGEVGYLMNVNCPTGEEFVILVFLVEITSV